MVASSWACSLADLLAHIHVRIALEVYRKYLESHALSADEILEEVGRERPFKAAHLMAPEYAGVFSHSREEIKSVLEVKVVSWEESWTDRTGHPQRRPLTSMRRRSVARQTVECPSKTVEVGCGDC